MVNQPPHQQSRQVSTSSFRHRSSSRHRQEICNSRSRSRDQMYEHSSSCGQPQPIVATATVRVPSNRSQSVHYSAPDSPSGTTLSHSRTSTLNRNMQTRSLTRDRSPSPVFHQNKAEDAIRKRFLGVSGGRSGVELASAGLNQRQTCAPLGSKIKVNLRGNNEHRNQRNTKGEGVSFKPTNSVRYTYDTEFDDCEECKRAQQNHQQYNSHISKNQGRNSCNKEVPSIPIGSKIDVRMRGHGKQPVNFQSGFVDDCAECQLLAQQQQQQRPPQNKSCFVEKAHHKNSTNSSQLSSDLRNRSCKINVDDGHQGYVEKAHHQFNNGCNGGGPQYHGPARIQIGDMNDRFQNYQQQKQKQQPPCQPNPKPVCQVPQDTSPLRGRTVVVSKQVENKQVIQQALASSRRKLNQLDNDLDKALKRLQDRNNRTENYCTPQQRSDPPGNYHHSPNIGDRTFCTEAPGYKGPRDNTLMFPRPTNTSLPMGSNIVLITLTDDGHGKNELHYS